MTDAVELRLAQFPHVEHVGEVINIQGFNQTFSRCFQHVVVKQLCCNPIRRTNMLLPTFAKIPNNDAESTSSSSIVKNHFPGGEKSTE